MNINIDEELRTAITLLQKGFCEYQKIDLGNDFYHLPFSSLSSGFERLMKCIICYKYLKDNGCFPTNKELKNLGHNLINLKKKIVFECISKPTSSTPIGHKKDYEFISDDKELEKILKILSLFGDQGRYHDLNTIAGEKNPNTDFKKMWEDYEVELMKEHPNWTYKEMNERIISKLEHFTRVLVYQFMFGEIKEVAKGHKFVIDPFLNLKDEEFGKTDYCSEK